MVKLDICLVLFCLPALTLSVSPIYVDNQSANPSPDGSFEAPFADLTQALLSSADLQVAISFPGQRSDQAYTLQTIGTHAELFFNCSENTIKTLYPIVVYPGMVAKLQNCHLVSDLPYGAMMVVLGGVEIEGGSIQNLSVKGFVLYGMMLVSGTAFRGNGDSLFAVQNFGVQLIVGKCVFEGNTSPVGTLLLLGFSGTNPDSTTLVKVDNCAVVGNAAYMGGSFAYLSVSPDIQFSPTQRAQTRQVLVQDSEFHSNPGYLCILFSQFLNVTFHSNLYRSHNYGFLIKLQSDSITLSNSSVSSINRFAIVTHLVGTVHLQGLNITHIIEGPAILIVNDVDQSLGLVNISHVEIRNFTLLNVALFSSTLFAYRVQITVSDFSVAEGDSYACALGCYFFSSVLMNRASMDKVVVEQGASVAFLGSNSQVSYMSMTNSTLTRVAYSGVFYSIVTFYHLSMAPGLGSYSLPYAPATNLIICFDSVLYVKGAFFDVPPVASYVAFYIWSSRGEVHNVTFPVLYANIADVYSGGSLYVRNLTIHRGKFEFLAFISFNAKVTYEDIVVKNTALTTLFSALSHSTITARSIALSNVSMESIAIASKSFLDLAEISLLNVHADTLFWYCSGSDIHIADLTVMDSTFDLTQFFAGTLELKNTVFKRVTVKRRFITAQKATIVFDNFELDGLIATSVIPFAQLTQHSTLIFKNSKMSNFRSREQGLVSIIDSSLQLENTYLSDFNATFAYGVRANVEIADSVVFEGGLKLMDENGKAKGTAGLLDCVDCTVSFTNTQFRNISGIEGGVVSISRNSHISAIHIEMCEFELCSASNDGGAIRAAASNVSISSTVFHNNNATRGACLYFECSDPSQCSSEITFSNFTNNSAREGAGVKWTLVRPHFSNNTSAYNKAVYGEFEASVPTHMVLANSNDSAMTGVPGVVVVEPILIAFMDHINQLVATDHSSIAIIQSDQIIGTTYLLNEGGISNFSGVIVQTLPGTTVSSTVFSPTINTTFPNSPYSIYSFDYHTRLCIPGEVTSPQGCYLCPKNTYSVDPLDSDCRECPGYATCPGGSELLLDPGYWRKSELSSQVFLCPIASACLGGLNSTCADGLSDQMCAKCAKGYYLVGLSACVECESMGARAIRSAIFLSVLIALGVLYVRKSPESVRDMKAISVLTILKILLNYLHSVMIISVITVDWRWILIGLNATVEMFLSLALSAFSIECYWGKIHIDSDLKPVYVKAILAITVPIGLLLLNICLFLLLNRFSLIRLAYRRLFQTSLLLLSVLTPYVVKTCLQLVACRQIDGERYWLSADVSVQCWVSPHYNYALAIFLPAFVLYILGVPFLFTILLVKLRASNHRNYLILLIAGYNEEHYYWEIAVQIRKLLLILAINLLVSIWIAQNLATMALLYLSLEWHLHTSPYQEPLHNKLEAWSLLTQLVFAGASFYLNADIRLNVYIQQGICIVVFTLLVLYSIACLFVLIRRLLPRKSAFSVIQTIDQEAVPSEVSVPLPSFESGIFTPAPSDTERQALEDPKASNS